ncbi:MAG: 6-pyruvoyl tetrahydrobiopterin synthase [Bacteroidia bacterium]|nr:MAG: 6-pyruvoyl tetrahydrobiopterin synthase [Bacteroidia bacterium]
MVYVTRREKFCSAHRLFREDWSEEKNKEVFGLCSNPKWHGHNYQLFVTVKGKVNQETGFVVNLKDLSRLIRKKIIFKLDHKNINEEVDFLSNKITSTENIVMAIWNELEQEVKLLDADLHCIKLVETENNSVEYYGE